jgi:hypothetical protein
MTQGTWWLADDNVGHALELMHAARERLRA